MTAALHLLSGDCTGCDSPMSDAVGSQMSCRHGQFCARCVSEHTMRCITGEADIDQVTALRSELENTRQQLARKSELLASTVTVADARLREIASLHGEMTALQRDVATWAAGTFPAATLASTFAHLRRELAEVEADPADPVEWADVLLIFLHASHRFGGMSWERILAAAREKFAVNQQRRWGEPDAEGVVEHVRGPAT